LSKFIRTKTAAGTAVPGTASPRLFGDQVSWGEPLQLEANAELRREVESSLESIARERLLEVEAQARSLLLKAKDEAAKRVANAEAKSKAILEQAQSEVDAIRDSAHEEGFKAGFEEGYADATNQVTDETRELLAGAHQLVEGAYLAEKWVLKHFEQRALGLIRHTTRQILGREMDESPEILLGLVQRAMDSLYLSGKVQVVVSVQIIHELRAYSTTLEQTMDGLKRFEFIADPGLERHQIYIIGQDNCFDLSPDTQLDHLLTAIEPHLQLPRESVTQAETEVSAAETAEEVVQVLSTELDSAPLAAITEPTVEEPVAAELELIADPEIDFPLPAASDEMMTDEPEPIEPLLDEPEA
jgi:flagellar assembly protein FliH